MARLPLHQNVGPQAGNAGTVRERPPLRSVRAVGTWISVAILASTAACASLPVGTGAFTSAPYSSLSPAGASFTPRSSSPAPTAHRAASLYAPNIAIGDSVLEATVAKLRLLSPAFDSAIVAIEASGIPVVIGTEAQLRDQLPPGYQYVSGWQALTAVYPLTANASRGRPIEHVAVIVRLSSLHDALKSGATKSDTTLFNRFIERVLAHEIYGHLMPQLALGKTAPIACDDPTSAANWYSACVMQRERHVMAELVKARGTYAALGTQ